MTRVVLGDEVREKLTGVGDFAELCDESGRMLGYFVPVVEHDSALYARVQSPISDEELERRRREPGGRTLAEIWTRLGR